MITDRGKLWFRVLSGRYGAKGRRLKEGGRDGLIWWRDLISISDGVGLHVRV